MTAEDIIKSTLRKLRIEKGYIIKINASYYSDVVRDEIISKNGKNAKYVFFTKFSSRNKFDIDGNLKGMLALDWKGKAKEIIEAFEDVGFSVEWRGSKEDLIIISSKEADIVTDLHTIELDREIFDIEGSNEEKFLVIKNQNNNEIYYQGFKGSLEQLWLILGNRGAEAENKKITLNIDDKMKNISIGEYINVYEELFKKDMKPIDSLFKNFKIKAVGFIRKSEHEKIEKLINQMGKETRNIINWEETNEESNMLKFEKEITNKDDFNGISHNFSNEFDWEIKFEINKI